MTDKQTPAEAFWQFSLRLYGRPGVAELCLLLQDGYRANVNLLLLCCWLNRHLDDADFNRLEHALQTWQDEVVAPLRAVRRRLKNAVDGVDSAAKDRLRRQLQQLELDAERIEQGLLVDAIKGRVNPNEDAAVANLSRYGERLGLPPALRKSLVARLAAAATDRD